MARVADSSSPALPITARERERERVFFAEASLGAASFAYCLTAEPRSSVVAPDRKEALGRGVIRRQSTRGSG